MHEFGDNFGCKIPISRKNTIESLLIGIGTDVNGFNHVIILNQDSNSNTFTSILCLRSLNIGHILGLNGLLLKSPGFGPFLPVFGCQFLHSPGFKIIKMTGLG